MANFTASELQRYSRHFSLPQIGLAGQQLLKNSAILCIGAGGIGSPVLCYLAAAGIGKIGIIDNDIIEISNLQRQILYTTAECGQAKVTIAKQRLLALNDNIEIVTHQEKLTQQNALDIVSNYTMVIDGSDNYVTRYLVNDACQINKIRLIAASLFQFSGQLLAFDYTNEATACYRCLYPAPPPAALIQNCAEAGIVGAVAGVLATLAATAAIKLACGMESGLENQLLIFDGLQFETKKYHFQKNTECELCSKHTAFSQLSRFDDRVCALPSPTETEITAAEVIEYLNQHKDILFIDVRNDWERMQGYVANCLHLPLAELEQLATIPSDFNNHDAIVLYCSAGIRSLKAVKLLQQHGLQHVYSLKGGFHGQI